MREKVAGNNYMAVLAMLTSGWWASNGLLSFLYIFNSEYVILSQLEP